VECRAFARVLIEGNEGSEALALRLKDDQVRLAPFGISLIVAFVGNLAAILIAATVLRAPPGSAIRPMHIPLYLLVIAACSAIIGLCFATETWKHGQRLLATVGMLLCLTPLFIGLFAFSVLVRLFDYTLKP
jgi:hypothetical protein